MMICVGRRWPDLAGALEFPGRAQIDDGGNGQAREHLVIAVGQRCEIVRAEDSPPPDIPAMTTLVSTQIPEVERPVEADQPGRLGISAFHDYRISRTGGKNSKALSSNGPWRLRPRSLYRCPRQPGPRRTRVARQTRVHAEWQHELPLSQSQGNFGAMEDALKAGGLKPSALGDRLRSAREARGLTLDQLSASTGISKAHLSRLESGARQPSVGILVELAAALGTRVGALLGEDV